MNERDTFARPRVSILLPCRDAAGHLGEAIASIDTQTFTDYEVIAVDDGSRDETRARLEAWAARDKRVTVLRSDARGIALALRLASERARAPLLARMDADDIAHPDRLARQVQLLESRPAVVACGSRVQYFPRSEVRPGAARYEQWLNALIEPDQLARDLFVECPIAHPALMVRTDAFASAGGYRDCDWPEDYDLVFRLALYGQLANVPATLLQWREGAMRLSRTDARYAEDAFRRCKVHYLADRLRDSDGVVVWGAGPVGKAFGRLLTSAGHELRALIEVDPRKIGQTIQNVRVISPADLASCQGAYVLAAVAGPAPRAEIRAALDSAGWKEIEQYCAVA